MGAGIATVISHAIMSIVILIYYRKGHSSLTIHLNYIRMRLSTIKEILTIGFPTFVHTASFSLVAIVINTMLLQYGGDMYLAAYGVAQRVIAFAVMPINGIVQGMLPIVGYNYGAKLYERMRKTIWLSFRYVVIISVVVVLLAQLFPEYAMGIFTSDPEFIEIGSYAMKIIFSLYFIIGVQIIAFEQSYSGVDGDSASSTELYAILSSLAEVPIHQGFAVTGSVNQNGEIQPIGGVNEKIEGFYNVCKNKGLTGKQGVLIPHQNVTNLMLDDEVIDAVRNGQFHIYQVKTIEEGIEILTNVPAGKPNEHGDYDKDTVYGKVADKLHMFMEIAKEQEK